MTVLFSIQQNGEKSFHINLELGFYLVNPSSIHFLLYVEYN